MKKLLVFYSNSGVEDYAEQITAEYASLFQIDYYEKLEISEKVLQESNYDCFILALESSCVMFQLGLYIAKQIRALPRYYLTPLVFLAEDSSMELYCYRKFQCQHYFVLPNQEDKFHLFFNHILWEDDTRNKKCFQYRKKAFFLPIDEIVYAEMRNRILYIHTMNDVHAIPYLGINTFMEMIHSAVLVRCHKSYVVNLNYVATFDTMLNLIELDNNLGQIEVGKKYRDVLIKGMWLAP